MKQSLRYIAGAALIAIAASSCTPIPYYAYNRQQQQYYGDSKSGMNYQQSYYQPAPPPPAPAPVYVDATPLVVTGAAIAGIAILANNMPHGPHRYYGHGCY